MSETSNQLKLSFLSPERKLVTQLAVSEVTLPSSEGQIQVLPAHVNMVGTLETGVFRYKLLDASTQSEVVGFISAGFFRVTGDEVVVTAEVLELKNEIDLERALTAQKKSEEELNSPGIDEDRFKKYQLKLQRALVRQQLARNADA